MPTDPGIDQEGDPQDNFMEARDPAELMMCFILAAAYLGLAKYCWQLLLLVTNWKLLVNVEGFFITIAVLSILLGLRPYISPSSLQLSRKGIKYRAPYWPQRKTINWEQVVQIYISPELIVVVHKPQPNKKRLLPMLITSIYLADRDKIPRAVLKYCPITPVVMTSPHLFSRILLGLGFLAIVIWMLEMLIRW
jgi:hypothetical protein